MKTIILFIAISISLSATAQDIIRTTKGDTINCKIDKIKDSTVIFNLKNEYLKIRDKHVEQIIISPTSSIKYKKPAYTLIKKRLILDYTINDTIQHMYQNINRAGQLFIKSQTDSFLASGCFIIQGLILIYKDEPDIVSFAPCAAGLFFFTRSIIRFNKAGKLMISF